jgi:DNA-binding GntR family transcriptional regulator
MDSSDADRPGDGGAGHDPADPSVGWERLASAAADVRTHGGTAQESVAEAIRSGIRLGILPPGTRLGQTDVARGLAVSATPVREALRGLVTEGLVRSERRRGFFVMELDPEAIEEIYDLRALVEGHAIRLAVPLLTHEDLADLRRIHDAMDATEDWQSRVLLRESFYNRLYSVTARPRLLVLIDRLRNEVTRQTRTRPIRLNRPVHLPILEAAEHGDGDEAARVLEEHYREIAQIFRRFAREVHQTAVAADGTRAPAGHGSPRRRASRSGRATTRTGTATRWSRGLGSSEVAKQDR